MSLTSSQLQTSFLLAPHPCGQPRLNSPQMFTKLQRFGGCRAGGEGRHWATRDTQVWQREVRSLTGQMDNSVVHTRPLIAWGDATRSKSRA